MNDPVNTRRRLVKALGATALIGLLPGAPAFAGGLSPRRQGHDDGGGRPGILPARAEPHGYSLDDLARITAVFNTGDHVSPPPDPVDSTMGSKFQMLYWTPANVAPPNTFQVRTGIILYVPAFYIDDSPPVIGSFPDVQSNAAVLRYLYSKKQLGLQYTVLSIDGQDFPLDERYVSATNTPPLADGGGTHYICQAALVKPLKKGTHQIDVTSLFTGDALGPDPVTFSTSFVVGVH